MGLQIGNRALKISVRVGDLRSQNPQHELDVGMEHMQADIVCIQETHNARTQDKCFVNYRYISSVAQKINGAKNENGIWGVAIMIKNRWGRNIEKVARHSYRRIQISLNDGQKTKTLKILNTYAPNMGYSKELGEG